MILLKDNYYLKGDANCFQIIEQVKTKKGITYKPIAYYTTIKDAVNGFIKIKSRDYLNTTELQTINELMIFQNDIYYKVLSNMSSLRD